MRHKLFFILCISILSVCFASSSETDKNTKLIQAAKDGKLQDVQTLLSDGADVNVKDKNGSTSLMLASQTGNTEVVKLLLDKGADVNVKRKTDGVNALWMASQKGHTEVVKLLLEKGTDVDVKETGNATTALWIASQEGHTDVVKLLMEKGADVNVKKTPDSITALCIASGQGHSEVVKLLLDKGANVNVKRTDSGTTALFQASQNGHTEVVKLLLAKGADVNAKDIKYNTTALWMASQEGHTEVVKLLIDKGADVNVTRTTDGVSPLFIASVEGHIDIVKLLIAAKADINAKANKGGKEYTALSVAKNKEIKELLEKAGANQPVVVASNINTKSDMIKESSGMPLKELYLPEDLVEDSNALYASLDGLAAGSKESQERQRQTVNRLGLPLEVRTRKIGIVFRLIPEGSFRMGTPKVEQDRLLSTGATPIFFQGTTEHEVTLTKIFYCSKFEVTQGQWEQVMGINPSSFKNAGKDAPVERVSWNDCQKFLKKLSEIEGVPEGTYRLLTEAEWEYVCRAGTTMSFYCGNDLDSKFANIGGVTTKKVGSYQPNGWGLCDMYGNVWEWCQDWWGINYPSVAVTDPIGPASGSSRIYRGGSWGSRAGGCRSAGHLMNDPNHCDFDLGLRIARTLQSNTEQ